MTSRAAIVRNPLGLHARAAARFVRVAGEFSAHVRVGRGARVMDGKSIMGVLLLAAPAGAELVISADGSDEAAAVDALCSLVERDDGEGACAD
jgi:phosphocarrier protein